MSEADEHWTFWSAQAAMGTPLMAQAAPPGYRRPQGDEPVGFAYVCLICWANVSPSAVELHLEWHRSV